MILVSQCQVERIMIPVLIFVFLRFYLLHPLTELPVLFPSVDWLLCRLGRLDLRPNQVANGLAKVFLKDSVFEVEPGPLYAAPEAVEVPSALVDGARVHVRRVVVVGFLAERTKLEHELCVPLSEPDPVLVQEVINLLRLYFIVARHEYLLLLSKTVWLTS